MGSEAYRGKLQRADSPKHAIIAPRTVCAECRGTGRERCPYCKGRGKFGWGDGFKCTKCKEFRKRKCGCCRGLGYRLASEQDAEAASTGVINRPAGEMAGTEVGADAIARTPCQNHNLDVIIENGHDEGAVGMSDGQGLTKAQRFAEFLRRLGAAPLASNFDEAYRQLCDTIDSVEDEMTSILNDPSQWMTDGRMYPPQFDNMVIAPGRPDLKQFRSRRHKTMIANNGAIEIRDLADRPIFSKPGADGLGIV